MDLCAKEAQQSYYYPTIEKREFVSDILSTTSTFFCYINKFLKENEQGFLQIGN
jgi:hypothetical protein